MIGAVFGMVQREEEGFRMDEQIERTLTALHSRHLNGFYAENPEKARLKILELIPRSAVVGVGDSTAINQLRIPIIFSYIQ